MTGKLSPMGFSLYVRMNISKYMKRPTGALKMVSMDRENRKIPGIMIPGTKGQEPVFLNLLEGYEKVLSGVPVDSVMREYGGR